MTSPAPQQARKQRDALRLAGLRPVRIWVQDMRRPGFADECRRQSLATAAADASDVTLGGFIDAGLADVARDMEG